MDNINAQQENACKLSTEGTNVIEKIIKTFHFSQLILSEHLGAMTQISLNLVAVYLQNPHS